MNPCESPLDVVRHFRRSAGLTPAGPWSRHRPKRSGKPLRCKPPGARIPSLRQVSAAFRVRRCDKACLSRRAKLPIARSRSHPQWPINTPAISNWLWTTTFFARAHTWCAMRAARAPRNHRPQRTRTPDKLSGRFLHADRGGESGSWMRERATKSARPGCIVVRRFHPARGLARITNCRSGDWPDCAEQPSGGRAIGVHRQCGVRVRGRRRWRLS